MHSVNDFVNFVKSYNSVGNSLVNLPIYNDKICAYNDNYKVTTEQHFLRPTGRKGNIMKKYFNVSFQYSESVYCANIAHAESAEAVEAHYSAKYEWCKVSEATAADVEEAQRKGKPIVEIETAPKMPILTINQQEREALEKSGEWCPAMARECMNRNGINFDDIEDINNHYETHRWGSDTDRRYRKSAIAKAVAKVAANPRDYIRRSA